MRSPARQPAVVAATVLIPFALLAIWAKLYSPASWEAGVLLALNNPQGLAGDIAGGLNGVGNLPVWAVVTAGLALLLGVARGIPAGLLVALSALSDGAAYLVKLLVERDRPDTAATEQFFGSDAFSYPSGHTVRATALVAVVAWLLLPQRWRLPGAIVFGIAAGAAMGWARV
ncbi:MAG TPA: phosphatase PAP2 family protein, partial [Candidatus Limnocylindrales bacterium]|nr:phosphatase PAP2 family protein [Candidatus Limnocylindrales bacterium]